MQPEIGDYTTPGNDLLEELLADLVAAGGGEAVFGILVGGTAMFVLWWASDGDAAVPTLFAILVGGLMVPLLPGQYQTIARTIMLLGVATGIFVVARRYFMSPGAR